MHGPLLLSLTIPSGLLFQFMILPRPFVVVITSFALNLTKDVKHLRCCVKRKKRKKVSLPKYLGLSMFLSTAEIPPLPPAVGRKKTLLLIIRNSSKVKGGKALHLSLAKSFFHYWICSFLALFSGFLVKLFIFIVRSLKEIKTQTALCTTICTLRSKHVLSD